MDKIRMQTLDKEQAAPYLLSPDELRAGTDAIQMPVQLICRFDARNIRERFFVLEKVQQRSTGPFVGPHISPYPLRKPFVSGYLQKSKVLAR
jgi:hypothetical protein